MVQDPRTTSTVIHLALLGGQLAFAAIAIMIERSVPPPRDLSADLLLSVSIFVAVVSIGASQFVSRKLLRSAMSGRTGADRMAAGLRAFVARMAILEFAGFIALVSYLFSGEITFLGIFGVVFVAFVLGKPSEREWEKLQLGSEPAQ